MHLAIEHPVVCGNLNHSFFISRGEALEVFQLPEGLILDKVSCRPIDHSVCPNGADILWSSAPLELENKIVQKEISDTLLTRMLIPTAHRQHLVFTIQKH